MLYRHSRLQIPSIVSVGLACTVLVGPGELAATAEKTVRVFILAGQSNMEGGWILSHPLVQLHGIRSFHR